MSVPPVTIGSIPGAVAALCVECSTVYDVRVKACPSCTCTVYLLVLPVLDRRAAA